MVVEEYLCAKNGEIIFLHFTEFNWLSRGVKFRSYKLNALLEMVANNTKNIELI